MKRVLEAAQYEALSLYETPLREFCQAPIHRVLAGACFEHNLKRVGLMANKGQKYQSCSWLEFLSMKPQELQDGLVLCPTFDWADMTHSFLRSSWTLASMFSPSN
jgi:hypothetical protein